MRVSVPSTAGGSSACARFDCNARRSRHNAGAIHRELRLRNHAVAPGIHGALGIVGIIGLRAALARRTLVAEQAVDRLGHARFEPRIDARRRGREAAAAARQQRIFLEHPFATRRRMRELLAHDRRVVGMQVDLHVAGRQRQQTHGVPDDADDLRRDRCAVRAAPGAWR